MFLQATLNECQKDIFITFLLSQNPYQFCGITHTDYSTIAHVLIYAIFAHALVWTGYSIWTGWDPVNTSAVGCNSVNVANMMLHAGNTLK